MSIQVAEAPASLSTLAECEATISLGMTAFVQVGAALRVIRDERLYRATHPTFEDYCQDRWDMGRDHAYKTIAAAETVEGLYSMEYKPEHIPTGPSVRADVPIRWNAAREAGTCFRCAGPAVALVAGCWLCDACARFIASELGCSAVTVTSTKIDLTAQVRGMMMDVCKSSGISESAPTAKPNTGTASISKSEPSGPGASVKVTSSLACSGMKVSQEPSLPSAWDLLTPSRTSKAGKPPALSYTASTASPVTSSCKNKSSRTFAATKPRRSAPQLPKQAHSWIHRMIQAASSYARSLDPLQSTSGTWLYSGWQQADAVRRTRAASPTDPQATGSKPKAGHWWTTQTSKQHSNAYGNYTPKARACAPSLTLSPRKATSPSAPRLAHGTRNPLAASSPASNLTSAVLA